MAEQKGARHQYSNNLTPLNWPDDLNPQFLVTIDTEEEFDWDAPLERTGHGTVSTDQLEEFQKFSAQYGVIPLYFIDYPIVTDDRAVEFLSRAVAQGNAIVGTHLHPWVNPPHDEEVTPHNSFAGNLPKELEDAKLGALTTLIKDRIGKAPTLYRAGRYGIGEHSFELLKKHGYRGDFSVRPRFDYSNEHGPDFADCDTTLRWIDRPAELIELPLTTVYSGLLRTMGPVFARQMNKPGLFSAVMARFGLIERIPLTPEGISQREVNEAIDIALDNGDKILCFSFHSPSLGVGHTPYVRSEDDRQKFYAWWRSVFDHLQHRGVQPGNADELVGKLIAAG